MTKVLPRTDWTSTANGRAGRDLNASKVKGIALHYPADGNVKLADLSKAGVAERLRKYRTYHVGSHGWADIGYNFAVDQAGRVWNLTGWTIGAHAGAAGNPAYVGILLLVGNNEQPTQAMIDSVRAFRTENVLANYPKATAVLGHQQVPGNSTACPGKPAMTLIKSGAFTTEPKPTPKPPAAGVKARFGTLNVPLDAAKLPDGEARARLAAKQIHESNLDFVGMQELDRGRPGDTWYYARLILLALREHDRTWKIIKPTTALNENFGFYRPSKVTLKRRLADLILPSKAGGRHCNRFTFDKKGKTIAVRVTHLVEGKNHGSERETQAQKISEYIGGSTVIIGDFNQLDVPKAFTKKHKSARAAAVNSGTRDVSTFERMDKKVARTNGTGIIDQIIVPEGWTVNGYTVKGVDPDGKIDLPRVSDHFLVIVSVTIP